MQAYLPRKKKIKKDKLTWFEGRGLINLGSSEAISRNMNDKDDLAFTDTDKKI